MALVSRADASTLLVQFQFFGVFIVGLPDDGHEVAVKFIVQLRIVMGNLTRCESRFTNCCVSAIVIPRCSASCTCATTHV
jgi:hypothetical protein